MVLVDPAGSIARIEVLSFAGTGEHLPRPVRPRPGRKLDGEPRFSRYPARLQRCSGARHFEAARRVPRFIRWSESARQVKRCGPLITCSGPDRRGRCALGFSRLRHRSVRPRLAVPWQPAVLAGTSSWRWLRFSLG
jgi:hypothetical protein